MNIHLICNAHLDPVWLWEIDEGIGEALATFTIAADFCETYEDFIFNHNEVILYQWVKAYNPELFKRIKELVKRGRWHIMGGWYLQPDCNMPSGEAMIRQIGAGRAFFNKEFGQIPTTAINFDPFGHSRGMVAIMTACGFDSYIITRPSRTFLELPDESFTWEGFDGSTIQVLRRDEYNSQYGEAVNLVRKMIEKHRNKEVVPVLWGIGNHGGGPSKIDLDNIKALGKTIEKTVRIIHSTPENAFRDLRTYSSFPGVARDLNPWAPGCYTSQIRIKQHYRCLEDMLFWTEAAAVHAHTSGVFTYPAEQLKEAEKVMLMAQFHDILPGTSIRIAEEHTLRMLQYALEILAGIRRDIFFILAPRLFKNPNEGIPIIVYNPLPYEISTHIDCEFQPARQNWREEQTIYRITNNEGNELPSQMEKEASNLNIDWRKRIVFKATLSASSMHMFICRPVRVVPVKTDFHQNGERQLIITTPEIKVVFDIEKGVPVSIFRDGKELCNKPFGELTIFADSPDPWSSRVRGYNTICGTYSPQSPEMNDTGHNHYHSCCRIIEEGAVRTVIQSSFSYGKSKAIMEWVIPADGTCLDLSIAVNHLEPDTMLKLAIPVQGKNPVHKGQTMFGAHIFAIEGQEKVSQRWQSVETEDTGMMAILDNGIYGSHIQDKNLFLSLLHTSCYSALPIMDRPIIPKDRILKRMDMGRREFSFRFLFSEAEELSERLEFEAIKFSAKPYALSCFPGTRESEPFSEGLTIWKKEITCSTLKQSEDGTGYILRLYNSCARPKCTKLTWPAMHLDTNLTIKGKQFITLRIMNDGSCLRVPPMQEYLNL